MTPKSRIVSITWVCGALAIVFLATLTPQPKDAFDFDFFASLWPERIGQWRDAFQNLLLYAPLGLALGIRGMSGVGVAMFGVAVSLGIELLQFAVPGRDPVARDVVTNVAGAIAGWAVARTTVGRLTGAIVLQGERYAGILRHPGPRTATLLSLAWALLVSVVFFLTGWLLSPALPPPFYFGLASSSMDRSAGPVRIGSGSEERVFNGLIDEVRIYTRARSAQEIALDMNQAVAAGPSSDPDLAMAYGFDLDERGLASDASGLGRHATARGTTWTSQGRFGGALSFDGRSSEVTTPVASIDPGRGLTLEAWLFPFDTQRDDTAVITGDGFFVRAASYRSPVALTGVSFGSVTRMVPSPRRIPSRRWTHLAASYDGQVLRLYVNGRRTGAFHWSPHAPVRITLDGTDLPLGPIRNPTRLPAVLAGDFELKVDVRCGSLQRQPGSVLLVGGIQSIDVLNLEAAGSELRVHFPTHATRFGLTSASYRIPNALAGCAPGEIRSLLLRGPLQQSRLEVEGLSTFGISPGPGSGWTFVTDSRHIPVWLVTAVSIAFLAMVAFPFGFWARPALPSLAGAVILLAGLSVAPHVWGLRWVNWLELAGIVAGVVLGRLSSIRDVPAGSPSKCGLAPK